MKNAKTGDLKQSIGMIVISFDSKDTLFTNPRHFNRIEAMLLVVREETKANR